MGATTRHHQQGKLSRYFWNSTYSFWAKVPADFYFHHFKFSFLWEEFTFLTMETWGIFELEDLLFQMSNLSNQKYCQVFQGTRQQSPQFKQSELLEPCVRGGKRVNTPMWIYQFVKLNWRINSFYYNTQITFTRTSSIS